VVEMGGGRAVVVPGLWESSRLGFQGGFYSCGGQRGFGGEWVFLKWDCSVCGFWGLERMDGGYFGLGRVYLVGCEVGVGC
jgi:hypothetical protein